MAAPPFNPEVIAFDTQALREGGWPNPNGRLDELVEFARQFKTPLWFLQAAIDEAKGNLQRTIKEVATKLNQASEAAQKRGLTVVATSTGQDELLASWDKDSQSAIANRDGYVVGYTTRPPQEFFTMAIDRVKPFEENGAGFRDAVMLASLADEMKHLKVTSAILVTADGDFRGAPSFVAGQEIRVMRLSEAVENYKQLLHGIETQAVQTMLADYEKRQTFAICTITSNLATIETRLNDLLEVGSVDVPDLNGILQRPISFSVAAIEDVSLRPLFRDVKEGTEVEASVQLNVTGTFEIIPFSQAVDTKLKVGQFKGQMASSSAGGGDFFFIDPQKQVIERRLPVAADVRLTRTPDGYDFVSMNSARPTGIELLALRRAILGKMKD